MGSTPLAVVVGLDCLTGLQTARILAARGIPVLGVTGDPRHFASRTRVCERVLVSEVAGERLIDDLELIGPTLEQKAVLFCCTDTSVLLVSRERARLDPWYHVLLPKHEVVELLTDKVAFTEHALAASLPIPPSVVVRTRDDAVAAAATLRFPCVVKPPVKSPRWQQQTKAKVFRVTCPDELLACYDRVAGWVDALVVSEWVDGGEDDLYSCNAYFDAKSRPVATFVARKLRQWPCRTGTSCLGEECRNDPVLAETVRLFTGVGYHGLAYLEMKRDARTGKHLVIEPNVGRPTGRSAIAEAGGVELLLAAYCDAVGEPLPANLGQTYTGVKWIDLRRDLMSAACWWWWRELTLRQWWRSVRGPKVHAVLSLTDPVPFVTDVVQTAGKAVAVLAGRRRLKEPT